MARPTIDGTRQLGDFGTVYNWLLSITKSPILTDDAGYAVFNASGAISGETLNLRCTATDLPNKTNNPLDANIRGMHSFQAGMTDEFGEIELTFLDTVDAPVERYFSAWLESQWKTSDGGQVSKLGSQGSVMITRLDRQGAGSRVGGGYEIFQYELIGAMCTSVTKPKQTSENGLYEVSARIHYDYYKHLFRNHPAVV